ncbi:MAG: polysaccharide biosynthesis tyrosine autokinase [Flavobacteriales bacterium]|nr:polysaccharide biosynthesis tyrosine autokinase [Flavobacteriales bacterium]MCB9447527.1 polysaccharide biosynthesis tyrosine autokinase [Flavobacteriales bacterium]
MRSSHLSGASAESKGFDVKSYALRCLRYWYLFPASLLIFIGYAFYNVRYSVPTYSVSASLLVNDEYSSWGREYFLSGLELVSARNRLVNEIGVIKSFPLIRRTLDSLDFDISYYDLGRVKTTELYWNSPFKVVADASSFLRLQGRKCHLRILSPETYMLQYGPEDNPVEEILPFGKMVTIGEAHFKVLLTQKYREELFGDKHYFFVFNNLDFMAKSYQNRVRVEPETKESSVLILSITGNCIKKEIRFLNKLMQVYIEVGREKNSRIAISTMSFINDQLRVISDSLSYTENDMEQFQRSNMNLGFGGSALSVYTSLVDLENNRNQLQLTKQYYHYLRDYLQKNDNASGLVIPSTMQIGDQILTSLVGRLVQLYADKEQMMVDAKTTGDNVLLMPINRQIKSMKALLLENLENLESKTNIDLQNVEKKIADARSQVNQLPDAHREMVNIQRQYSLNNNLYTYLLNKKAEASLAKAADITNANVLEKASMLKVGRTGPNIAKIYTTNVLFGLAIPFLIVFCFMYFDTRIVEKKDIEAATSIPILGFVGHSKKRTNLVVIDNFKSLIAESFRSIRTGINYMAKGQSDLVLLITSSVSSEGKTFTAINLASLYAASGKRVVLVGADMRRPRIFQDFKLNNEKGLSNYLIGSMGLNEIVQHTGIQNLDIISAGPLPPNPAELLESGQFKQLMDELRSNYNIVIIDTPPMGLVTDALLITDLADVILFMIRFNYTKKPQLQHINEQITHYKVKNIGIIANDVSGSMMPYSSGYGYGYGWEGYYSDDEPKPKGLFSFWSRKKYVD